MHFPSCVLLASTLALSAVAHEARADEPKGAPTSSPYEVPPVDNTPPVHPPSTGTRTAGQVLVVVGTIHFVAGTSVLLGFLGQSNCEGCTLSGILYGAPLMTVGLILTGVGVPLWASADASRSMSRATHLDLQAGPTGLALTGTF